MKAENQDKLREAVKLIEEVKAMQPEGSNLKMFLQRAVDSLSIVLPPVKAEEPKAEEPVQTLDK